MAEHILEWDDIRNFLVHGFLIGTFDLKGQHKLEYRRYNRVSSDRYELRQWYVTVDDLENACEHLTGYCNTFVSIMQKIYLEQGLEQDAKELF